MNLQKKQIEVLARKIYDEVNTKQKEQLESIKEEVKEKISKDLNDNYNELLEKFKLIDNKYITKITIPEEILISLNINSYCKGYSSIEDFKEIIFNNNIYKYFQDKFGKEVRIKDIEEQIILETIGSKTVEELILAVKKALLK